MHYRIGLGIDTHRLAPGDGSGILLGGIRIPYEKQIVAHSDGDVLIHALVDAILGAARLGDIGTLFSNELAENKDRCSAEMLEIVRKKAFDNIDNPIQLPQITNIDIVIEAEKVKISPYREKICEKLAYLLKITKEQVFVKGKTGEGVGPIGQEELIRATVVVLLEY